MNNFLRTFYVCAFVACFFVIGLPVSAETAIWHSGQYHVGTSTVWHTGEIHAVADGASLIIDPGSSLSLEPGVILKMGYNSDITVYGGFYASGTKDNMINIVSLRDDTVGGDTNGDGNATMAKYDDWRIFKTNGSSYNSPAIVELNYVALKHVNQSVMYAYYSQSIKIANCDIVDNLGSIIIMNTSNFSINHSNIYNPNFCDYSNPADECHWNNTVRLYVKGVFDLSDNFWGSAEGPTYTTGTIPTVFKGVILANLYGGQANYSSFASKPFDFNVKKQHPVILIPGIMGSWPDLNGDWQLDPILHTYDDLLGALRLAGYEDGKTLFSLSYDWSQSNNVTAGLLKDKINAVKAACVPSDIFDCSKVDLIGHSMGGIVARTYIEGADYQNDVDQMIFVAVPQKGSPKDYLLWEGGDVDEDFVYNLVYKSLLEAKAELNGFKTRPYYDGIMYYVRAMMPSVRELLPVYDYLREKDSGQLRIYPNNYPVNNFLENLNLPVNLAKLNQIKITNILGNNGLATIKSLRVIPPLLYYLDGKWENGIPENYNFLFTDRGLELGSGDGTVPDSSGANFNNVSDIIINNADHLSVVSLAQNEIVNVLTGKKPEAMVTHSPIENLLVFRIFSPADFQIIAPDGKRLGRDLNVASTSVLNEIPGSYYTGFNNSSTPEMAIITDPLAGDYRIELIGTGNGGGYRMSASIISDSTSSDSDYSGQILPDQNKSIALSYDSASSSLSRLKPNITINTAIDDVNMIYDRKLLVDNKIKKKIIRQYESLLHEIEKIDESEHKTHHEEDKFQEKIREKIIEELGDMNEYLKRLVLKNVLNQQGYDIIKSNNDYLTNNWQ